MRQAPIYTTWTIRCQSPQDAESFQRWLCARIDLEHVITDKVRTVPDGVEQVQNVQHRLGDYFAAIRLVPEANGTHAAFRLVFQRRPDSGKYWKDLMVSILQEIEEAPLDVLIELAAKGEAESASLAIT